MNICDNIKSIKTYTVPAKLWHPRNWDEKNMKVCEIFYWDFSKKTTLPDNTANKKTNLDGVKKIYFVYRTHFNRSLFKEMYPDIKIVKSAKDADIIAYNENHLTKTFLKSGKIYYIINGEFAVDKRFMSAAKRKTTYIPKSNIFDPENRYNYCSVQQISELTQQAVDIIKSLFHNNKNYISTDDIFRSAKIEFRQENISINDLIDLTQQILSPNKDIRNLAIDIISQMDMEKYGEFQTLAYFIYSRSGNHYNKTPRSKVLKNSLLTSPTYLKIISNLSPTYKINYRKNLKDVITYTTHDLEQYQEYNQWLYSYVDNLILSNKEKMYDRNW